jgi:hypothetical protein
LTRELGRVQDARLALLNSGPRPNFLGALMTERWKMDKLKKLTATVGDLTKRRLALVEAGYEGQANDEVVRKIVGADGTLRSLISCT